MTIGSFSSHPAGAQGSASDIYTDLNSLQKIKQMGRGDDTDKKQALEAVAKQFESVFLNMMMKSMRNANEAFKDESMSSNEMDFYQQMFDQQLALSFSKNGVGIADALVRQLKRQIPSSSLSNKLDNPNHLTNVTTESQRQVDEKNRAVLDSDDNNSVSNYVSKKVTNTEPELSFTSPEDFIAKLYPMAKSAANKLGVGAETILSQAALETGWGQHMIKGAEGKNSFNLFGIKTSSSWEGSSARVQTLEYEDGVAKKQSANFRAYSSYRESFDDYANFIASNGRYQLALSAGNSSEEYVRQLQDAGYATDPDYADKILNIEQRYFQELKEAGSRGVEI